MNFTEVAYLSLAEHDCGGSSGVEGRVVSHGNKVAARNARNIKQFLNNRLELEEVAVLAVHSEGNFYIFIGQLFDSVPDVFV